MYAKILNGQVSEYPINNIRQSFPNISFPIDILDEHLPENIVKVYMGEIPIYTDTTHKLLQRPVPELIDGKWQILFDVIPLSEDEKLNNVPNQISMRQCRLQLLKLNLLNTVSIAIDNIVDDNDRENAKIEWEYSSVVERNSQWVNNLSISLGLSSDHLNELFISASKL